MIKSFKHKGLAKLFEKVVPVESSKIFKREPCEDWTLWIKRNH